MAVRGAIQLSIDNLPFVLPSWPFAMTGFVGAVAFYWLTQRIHSHRADHSPRMSPDTVSSLFPDRPIRPLPKRRLRDRLSPEVADAINYPPLTYDASPLFYYQSYALKDEGIPTSSESSSEDEQTQRYETGRRHPHRRNGVGVSDGDEEEPAARSTLVARSPPSILVKAARCSGRPGQPRYGNTQGPLPKMSSVDGYESFEFTNNKKKRKIPSAGDSSSINGTHELNNETGPLEISGAAHSPRSDLNGDGACSRSTGHSSSNNFMSSSQGISGPGRGRLGRPRNARSPLRTLFDGSNSWAGRASRNAPPQWASSENKSTGIISSAIANAEKLPPQGQENVSLLQQHSSSGKTAPAATQFTFTCDSQVPSTIQWPAQTTKYSMGTQASTGGGAVPSATNGAQHDGASKPASSGLDKSRRKNLRRLEKELNTAARQRRQLAADSFYRSPPKLEDIWVCEFCEYERIFGEPPRALVRAYELKDRQHRREEADRKRLLEKAKAKSRKARKSGKTAKAGQTASHNSNETPVGPQEGQMAPPMRPTHSRSTQSEGDYEDESDKRYMNPPPDIIQKGGGSGTNI